MRRWVENNISAVQPAINLKRAAIPDLRDTRTRKRTGDFQRSTRGNFEQAIVGRSGDCAGAGSGLTRLDRAATKVRAVHSDAHAPAPVLQDDPCSNCIPAFNIW
jgi:hypothetical protein